METTLVLVKPDGVTRNLTGEILWRFERRGLRIKGLKMMQMSQELAERHYSEHQGKPFYTRLVDYITSGPIIAVVLEGENAVRAVRAMIGSTNPSDAAAGTIRGDFALTMENNVIHGSDGVESAQREVAIFFAVGEMG